MHIMLNMDLESRRFELPVLAGRCWVKAVDTAAQPGVLRDLKQASADSCNRICMDFMPSFESKAKAAFVPAQCTVEFARTRLRRVPIQSTTAHTFHGHDL